MTSGSMEEGHGVCLGTSLGGGLHTPDAQIPTEAARLSTLRPTVLLCVQLKCANVREMHGGTLSEPQACAHPGGWTERLWSVQRTEPSSSSNRRGRAVPRTSAQLRTMCTRTKPGEKYILFGPAT